MAYTSAAVYDAVVAIQGGFQPYGPPITAPPGASVDCAINRGCLPDARQLLPSSQAVTLGALYAEALSNFGGCTGDGGGGTLVGQTAATNIIALRTGDGRMIPIGTTSLFPTLPPAPGVWRLTPPFATPQTPWVGSVRPFIVQSLDQFLPDPPPSLQSDEWVDGFDQTKAYGAATGSLRSDEQTFIAKFWSANVIRQVQSSRARHRGDARPQLTRHSTAGRDGQRSRCRCNDVQDACQVPLLVLATGHCDQRIA